MLDLVQRLLQFTGDGVYRYTWDEGRILLANDGLVRILDLDCTPQDLVGKRLHDLLVYTEKEGTVRQALADKGEIHDFHYHFKTLKGTEKWVIHDSFVVEDPDTHFKCVEAIVKDITDRKLAENALAAEKERLAVTIGSIGDAVIATDNTGTITLLNHVAEQLTGWPENEAIGRPLASVLHIVNEQTRQDCEDPVAKVIKTGLVIGLANHTVLIARDGTELVIADSGAPIRVHDGRIIGVVLVFRDMTAQRAAERVLQNSLKEKELLLKEIHHRVKNNMQVIFSLLSLQAKHIRDPQAAEALTESQNRVRSMALVHEKLYHSHNLARVDFASYINELAADLLRTYQVEPGNVSLEVKVDPVEMSIDTAIPCGLMINELIANCLKHAFAERKTGRVRVGLKAAAGHLTLSVSDNGIGFAGDVDIESPKSLGLQLIVTLAQQLEGKVSIERKRGTTVKIVFPHPPAARQ